MSKLDNEEILRQCDEYLSRLRLSIDIRLQKMRDINKTISNDLIWGLITNSLEAFSLLDTAQQYEEFISHFNSRIRDKQTTLDAICDKLGSRSFAIAKKESTATDGSEMEEREGNANVGICNVNPTLSGQSLTEACYKSGLQTLIEKDPKLRGVPLRCAAVSKLCELRIKAEHFLSNMSSEELETCVRTKHVKLDARIATAAPLSTETSRTLTYLPSAPSALPPTLSVLPPPPSSLPPNDSSSSSLPPPDSLPTDSFHSSDSQ